MKRAWIGLVGLGWLAGCPGADTPGGSGVGSATSGIDPTGVTIADASTTDDEEPTTSGSVISDSQGGECQGDIDCPDGEICNELAGCEPGCSDDKPCSDGLGCCDGTCIDLLADVSNCGECGEVCEGEENCNEGFCAEGECPPGFSNCDGDMENGCEVEGDCACAAGETQSCYSGEAATRDVGACAAGTQTCNDAGDGWGPCEGEVLPTLELCANEIDDNCDGDVDEEVDADGDGWTNCGGDCCDESGPDCAGPELVNPGAFEVDGNEVDDDCDGVVDNPVPACDADLASNTNETLDYARALDLCQFTEETPATPEEQVWGVISADLLLADDTGVADPNSRSLRDGFGDTIGTQFGDRLVVLSTGHAADNAGDVNPSFSAFQLGTQMGETSPVPADWLAANGGNFPNAPGCPDPAEGGAFNPVNLRLRMRAPTNANSFSVQMYFFSAEYPEYVCTAFNDFFITLVDSEDPENPDDGNIAIFDDGAQTWPVGINLVSAAAGLFEACSNGPIAQCGDGGSYNGCVGPAELAGTGFDVSTGGEFACVPTAATGGGTGWLTMTGNVEPGEVFEVRFVIWDTSDEIFDSLVLLDDWQWSLEASEPGVSPS
ncbi:MAG: choice-of-anchor L domain-containing protein [Myxococcota bacterium]